VEALRRNWPELWGCLAGLCAIQNHRPHRAAEMMEYAELLPGFDRTFAPFWVVYTEALHLLGEHWQELEMARRARRVQPWLLSLLDVELRAAAALGQVDRVEQLLEDSLSFPPERWRSRGMRPVMAALELRAHGLAEAARVVATGATDWIRARPLDDADPYALGRALYCAERWEEALRVFRTLYRTEPQEVTHPGCLGTVYARLGDRRLALSMDCLLATLTAGRLRGTHTLWRAKIAAILGEADQALALLRHALEEGRPFGAWLHREMDFESLCESTEFKALAEVSG
jgi:tetratricopeptide (TPR) repeat protein